MMTFGESENGLRYADFECCEDVEMEPFVGNCKVQIMRDGMGQNGKFYFVFSMPSEQLDELPAQLVRQASAVASKVLRQLIIDN